MTGVGSRQQQQEARADARAALIAETQGLMQLLDQSARTAEREDLVASLEPDGAEFTTTVRTCACGRHFSLCDIERDCCSACARDMLPSRNPLLGPYDEVEAMTRAKLWLSQRGGVWDNDALFGPRLGGKTARQHFNHIDTENAILEELGYGD